VTNDKIEDLSNVMKEEKKKRLEEEKIEDAKVNEKMI